MPLHLHRSNTSHSLFVDHFQIYENEIKSFVTTSDFIVETPKGNTKFYCNFAHIFITT